MTVTGAQSGAAHLVASAAVVVVAVAAMM
jgi:hypothetical protein